MANRLPRSAALPTEAGHALQDATGYPLLGLRNGLVPMASLGSQVFWLLMLAGCMLVAVQSLWGETGAPAGD